MLAAPADSADQAQALEQLLAAQTRQPEARAGLAKLLDQDPSTLTYLKWSRRLPDFVPPRRIAVLTSYTLETIAPFLAVEAYLSGWQAKPDFLQYSRWQPALLDPGAALDVHDAAVLLLDETAITGRFSADGMDAANALTNLLTRFRMRAKASLFIGLIPARPHAQAFGLGHDESLQALSRLQQVNAAIASFCLGDGASHVIDVPGALSVCGQGWHDAAAFAANMSYVSNKGYPALARTIARSIGALLVPRHKVLATDLDGTLWGGILGEDGGEGIVTGRSRQGRPFASYQEFLKQLRASGVILAIVSKNDETDVRAAFEARKADLRLAWDDFTVAKVNWNDKSANLRAVAHELGLGLDSFVFVDDSPMECAAIRHSLPMVTVVPTPADVASLPERILATRAFDALVMSNEDRARADHYRAEGARRQATTEAGEIESFLASLDLKVMFSSYGKKSGDRILQLLLKTNQFHLTLERPSPAVLSGRLAEGNEIHAIRLSDRFGDYGIIGVLELEATPPTMSIRNLAVSCRALGRRVEDAILAFAASRARVQRCDRLDAVYVEGPRNRVIEEALQRLGFTSPATAAKERAYSLPVTASSPEWPKHVEKVFEGEAA